MLRNFWHLRPPSQVLPRLFPVGLSLFVLVASAVLIWKAQSLSISTCQSLSDPAAVAGLYQAMQQDSLYTFQLDDDGTLVEWLGYDTWEQPVAWMRGRWDTTMIDSRVQLRLEHSAATRSTAADVETLWLARCPAGVELYPGPLSKGRRLLRVAG